ncbi:MAG: rRNA maturation RNase YbeY [Candidatus Hydrogenedentes bacterium]|jgi:probable rRNA maturation factor|nr:rRNA maturation RNase YbeY [Candidatus Hydrogenedentota bacterium]
MIHLDIRNQSKIKRLISRGRLEKLAEKICAGEGVRKEAELSLLFCDDSFIKELNAQYRNRDEATDVLSFVQEKTGKEPYTILGDIVISLETVERYCGGDRDAMRTETLLLFCHGLLHLLGYEHGNEADKIKMQMKQAHYLDLKLENVWH